MFCLSLAIIYDFIFMVLSDSPESVIYVYYYVYAYYDL